MNQLLSSYPLKSESIITKKLSSFNYLRLKFNSVKKAIFPVPTHSIKDKELEIAQAWKSASSDIHYYNDAVLVKTPSYYPFIKLN